MNIIKLPLPWGKNRDERTVVNQIIIHAMSEYVEYEGAHYSAVELLRTMRLSCHYMVTPSAAIIECADPRFRTTWHAKRHNTHSVGIEVLMPGLSSYAQFIKRLNNDWVKPAQLCATAELCEYVEQLFNGAPMTIVGHDKLDPDRKNDPGLGFPWLALEEMVESRRKACGTYTAN